MTGDIILPVILLLGLFVSAGVCAPKPTFISFLVLWSIAVVLLTAIAGFLYSYLTNWFNVLTVGVFNEQWDDFSTRFDNMVTAMLANSNSVESRLTTVEKKTDELMKAVRLIRIRLLQDEAEDSEQALQHFLSSLSPPLT